MSRRDEMDASKLSIDPFFSHGETPKAKQNDPRGIQHTQVWLEWHGSRLKAGFRRSTVSEVGPIAEAHGIRAHLKFIALHSVAVALIGGLPWNRILEIILWGGVYWMM